jgi:hypothetical protein
MSSDNNENQLDYSNTIIYKITCKNPIITNIYVGHTINFCQRQNLHKYNCYYENSSNYNCKLYQTIRENGGWNNWKMNIVNFFNCANKHEALQKEQEYFILLNADLNSVEPCSNKSLIKYKKKNNNSIINNLNTIKDVSSNFSCSICSYYTNRKSQYDRHLNTTKHKNFYKVSKYTTKVTKDYICTCGKSYKYDSGYYRHKKICDKIKTDTNNVQLNADIKNILSEILEICKQIQI